MPPINSLLLRTRIIPRTLNDAEGEEGAGLPNGRNGGNGASRPSASVVRARTIPRGWNDLASSSSSTPNRISSIPVNLDEFTAFTHSFNILAKRSIMNSSWVTLASAAKSSSTTSRSVRLVYRQPPSSMQSDGTVERNVIFLHPRTMYELDLEEGDPLEIVSSSPRWSAARGVAVLRVTPVPTREELPPIAQQITIARVRSPHSSGFEDYAASIRDFFRRGKIIVAKGDLLELEVFRDALDDVLGAELKTTTSSSSDSSSSSSSRPSVRRFSSPDLAPRRRRPPLNAIKERIHFKVVDVRIFNQVPLENAEAIVDVLSEQTSIVQAGAVSSRLPPALSPGTFPRFSPTFSELERLLAPQLPPRRATDASTPLDRFPVLVTLRDQIFGADDEMRFLAARAGRHFLRVSLVDLIGLPTTSVLERLKEIFKEARECTPCLLALNDFESLIPISQSDKEEHPDAVAAALYKLFYGGSPVGGFERNDEGKGEVIEDEESDLIVVAVVRHREPGEVPSIMRALFTYEVDVKPPGLDERSRFVSSVMEEALRRSPSLARGSDAAALPSHLAADIAPKTAGRSYEEIRALISSAALLYSDDGEKEKKEPIITLEAVRKSLDRLPPNEALQQIGAPKIPSVLWDDVGGLGHAKEEITEMVKGAGRGGGGSSGARARSGILLYGPPGTGKTLLAKAVATECALNFISIKGPELLDMYVGESERKIRRVFETARAAKPCVLFFDELDSLAPARGRGSEGGGVMDRVVSQLLTEIDGMSNNADVFVIGATNRPDLLDSSLLRPGRFDRLIYLGISTTREDQLKILRALTRKYTHAPDVDLAKLLEDAPRNLTGADFYSLASTAVSIALKRKVEEVREASEALGMPIRKFMSTLSEKDLEVTVCMADYQEAKRGLVPSVSLKELERYEALRVKFATTSKGKGEESESSE